MAEAGQGLDALRPVLLTLQPLCAGNPWLLHGAVAALLLTHPVVRVPARVGFQHRVFLLFTSPPLPAPPPWYHLYVFHCRRRA